MTNPQPPSVSSLSEQLPANEEVAVTPKSPADKEPPPVPSSRSFNVQRDSLWDILGESVTSQIADEMFKKAEDIVTWNYFPLVLP
jgi:hypothetical protein